MRLRIPSFHIHIAICVGDDEDVDVGYLLRGWRGRVLKRIGFHVEERWALMHRPGEDHIVPVGDGMYHELSASECICGPFVMWSKRAPGMPDKYVITHASLDARESPPSAEELDPQEAEENDGYESR